MSAYHGGWGIYGSSKLKAESKKEMEWPI